MRQLRRGVCLALAALTAACGAERSGQDASRADAVDSGSSTASEIRLVDASGDTLVLDALPERIVALIPSVNQILVELGVRDRLVGRTDYDTLSALAALPSVGGGLGANLETMTALDPDLVIGFHGSSDARTRDRLRSLGIPHLGVRPDGIEDVRAIIHQMGALTGRPTEAATMVQRLDDELDAVRAAVASSPPVRAGYLLGGTPPLAAGPGTFLEELLQVAGAINVFGDLTELYAPVSPETVLAREIDVVLLTEGAEVDGRILSERRVARIPSWVQIPGPDLAEAARLVAQAIHPELSFGGPDSGRPTGEGPP